MKFLKATRYTEWWEYKLCPLLAVGYATILMGDVSFVKAALDLAFLLFPMIMGGIFVSLINDITDIKEDLKCGKTNRMAGVPVVLRWILPLLSFSIGFFALCLLRLDLLSFILCLIPVAAFSLYSFEPFRLKRRGVWGILADASGSHIFTSLYILSATSYLTGQEINWVWFTAVGVWALCYGLRGILWHQFLDRENDILVGLNTFATSRNPEIFRMQPILIFSLEILALMVMLIEIGQPLCILFLAGYLFVVLFRRRTLGQKIILVYTPINNSFQVLMLDYYQLFLPISLLIVAVSGERLAIWVLAVHVILFPQRLIQTIKDSLVFLRRLILQRVEE